MSEADRRRVEAVTEMLEREVKMLTSLGTPLRIKARSSDITKARLRTLSEELRLLRGSDRT